MRSRSYPDQQRYNPCRPPDWRWRRAVQLVADGTYLIKWRDDEPTRRAVKLLRALKRCRSERGVRGLTKRKPSMMMALKLREAGGIRCQELHARVLARQSAVAIARVMGMTVGMVEVYVEWFFAVSDRIKAPGYVLSQVVKWPIEGSVPTVQQLMLAVAYYHGPHALEGILDYLPHAEETYDLTTAVGRQRESISLLHAVHCLPSDEAARDSLVKKAPYVLETGSNLVRTRSLGHVLTAGTAQIVAELPWATPDRAPFVSETNCRQIGDGSNRHNMGMVA